MHDLPDLSQLCVGHAPVPTAVKNYKPKNEYMQKNNVPGSIIFRKRWEPVLKAEGNASQRVELKAKVFDAFEKESKGPNLFSMTKLMPILMDIGMAMAEYGTILPKLVQALLKTETGLGRIVSTQRNTRQAQALNILQTLYRHSFSCRPELCGPLEGPQFRNQLQQAMWQAMPDKATYDYWHGRVTNE